MDRSRHRMRFCANGAQLVDLSLLHVVALVLEGHRIQYLYRLLESADLAIKYVSLSSPLAQESSSGHLFVHTDTMTEPVFSEQKWRIISALSLDQREQLEATSRSLPFVPQRHVATGHSNMFLLYSSQGISAYRPAPHWIAPDHLLAGWAHF